MVSVLKQCTVLLSHFELFRLCIILELNLNGVSFEAMYTFVTSSWISGTNIKWLPLHNLRFYDMGTD